MLYLQARVTIALIETTTYSQAAVVTGWRFELARDEIPDVALSAFRLRPRFLFSSCLL